MRGVNNGQRLLVESAASLATIAKACDVARPTARRWKLGECVPREEARVALRDAYGIGVGEWDVALPANFEIKPPPPLLRGRPKKSAKKATPKKPAKKKTAKAPAVHKPPPYPDEPPADASIATNLRYSLTCIRCDLRHGGLTTSARSKLRSDEARTLALVAKVQREEELSEDRYVKGHPAFKAHCERILEALKPFPDAARAVARALRNEPQETST